MQSDALPGPPPPTPHRCLFPWALQVVLQRFTPGPLDTSLSSFSASSPLAGQVASVSKMCHPSISSPHPAGLSHHRFWNSFLARLPPLLRGGCRNDCVARWPSCSTGPACGQGLALPSRIGSPPPPSPPHVVVPLPYRGQHTSVDVSGPV